MRWVSTSIVGPYKKELAKKKNQQKKRDKKQECIAEMAAMKSVNFQPYHH
jgi:hypothetical protein